METNDSEISGFSKREVELFIPMNLEKVERLSEKDDENLITPLTPENIKDLNS